MSRQAKMVCVKCGTNITMEGAPVCAICDPNIEAIMVGSAKSKTPNLCLDCFDKHTKEHVRAGEMP